MPGIILNRLGITKFVCLVIWVEAKALSIVSEKSLLSREVPGDWKKWNITPIYKKGRKEDLECYRAANLTFVLV